MTEPTPQANDGSISPLQRFMYLAEDEYFDCFKQLSVPSCLDPIVAAFQQNLKSAFDIGSLPFLLVESGVRAGRFQQLRMSEEFRYAARQVREEDATKRAEMEAVKADSVQRVAVDRLSQELRENPGQFIDDIVGRLTTHLERKEFADATDELLRQVSVMAWGAFEVFVSDLVIALLNKNGSLVKALVQSKFFNDSFGKKGVSFDLLAQNGFDLSGKVGSVIFGEIKMDSIGKIRDVYDAIFADDAINASLKRPELWLLYHRRSLIVHRRAIVDQAYVSKTSDKLDVGSRLVFPAYYANDALVLVRDVAMVILASPLVSCD